MTASNTLMTGITVFPQKSLLGAFTGVAAGAIAPCGPTAPYGHSGAKWVHLGLGGG